MLVNRRFGGVCSPIKKGLKGTIPALVNRSVGSPAGMREALGIRKWPRSSKNRVYNSLIWSPVITFDPSSHVTDCVAVAEIVCHLEISVNWLQLDQSRLLTLAEPAH